MGYGIIDQDKFRMAFESLHFAENGGDIADALNMMRESLGLEPKVQSVPPDWPESPDDLYEWQSPDDYEDLEWELT